MTSDLRWRGWERWLRSGFYGRIIQLRLEELDKSLLGGVKVLVLGQNEQKTSEEGQSHPWTLHALLVASYSRDATGVVTGSIVNQQGACSFQEVTGIG
ncbi:hypothetical protein L873DRAFT_1818697 [Choiromyces venosus 120613-1]|uniref:Uncharacterized protein n=1 Tax=Choiromyces venosus 120613-1 TaxID=1336337 RepID=A0A3N4J5E5_9PEZI|nr:hypothetical protein L873DRAFT_1818697 [Choiromyces venosus 120613-1]